MYLNLFRLKELPFRLSPDPAFLYLSPQHARAKAAMESTLGPAGAFAVITGELGTGKTILIESFLRVLGPDVVLARLNQTQITPAGFLQGLLVQFGYAPFNMNQTEMAATLDAFLVEQHAAGRKPVLVIDEAQTLSSAVLEEIRRLSGAEDGGDPPLRIILAGQPELAEGLAAVELATSVRQRLQLAPLSDEESAAYVQHRLDVAGASGRRVFTKAAIAVIRRYTGGVPRLLNTLCDTSMMGSFALHKDTVDAAEVRGAIAELKWIEYAARTHQMPHTDRVARLAPAAAGQPLVGRLHVSTEGRDVAEVELRPGRLLIGRTTENDVQIDSKYVSRHHCQVTVTPDGVTVEDLNSTNGIVVAGQRVRRHPLQDGDRVRVGLHTLTYAAERPAGSHGTDGAGNTGTEAREPAPAPR